MISKQLKLLCLLVAVVHVSSKSINKKLAKTKNKDVSNIPVSISLIDSINFTRIDELTLFCRNLGRCLQKVKLVQVSFGLMAYVQHVLAQLHVDVPLVVELQLLGAPLVDLILLLLLHPHVDAIVHKIQLHQLLLQFLNPKYSQSSQNL